MLDDSELDKEDLINWACEYFSPPRGPLLPHYTRSEKIKIQVTSANKGDSAINSERVGEENRPRCLKSNYWKYKYDLIINTVRNSEVKRKSASEFTIELSLIKPLHPIFYCALLCFYPREGFGAPILEFEIKFSFFLFPATSIY
jgi:hypothetical protein